MSKIRLTLKPTEQVVAQSATQIFTAYISAELVRDGSEDEWIKRSVEEAVRIAKLTQSTIVSNEPS